MLYLWVRHKVADFDKWYSVFASHDEAQKEAGLHLLHLLRDTDDPNLVVLLFRVDDVEKTKAFIEAPSAYEAAENSGVIGEPEFSFLRD